VSHEGAVRSAFQTLLEHCGRQFGRKLVPEWQFKRGEALKKLIEKEQKSNPRLVKLSKDKRSLIYNDFLTLSGIPPEVFEYRLGNRSALEWIIDQYQVSIDKRSGITNDPNRADDPEYIVRLIGKIVTVSIETVNAVSALNQLSLLPDAS
jgi:predicted helicase